jgi:hypothetical protein
MSETESTTSDRPPLSVFLSYASEDRQAAQLIRDALPSYGLSVWYDENSLTGGDAWDQKIRRQIRECDLFMPLISVQTEARHEGYFRREWRLAVERTLDMADDHTFLLPIVIDDTGQFGARVPEKFLQVQWLKLPGGRPTPAFEALCRRLAAGDTRGAQAPRQPPAHGPRTTSGAGFPSSASAASGPSGSGVSGPHVSGSGISGEGLSGSGASGSFGSTSSGWGAAGAGPSALGLSGSAPSSASGASGLGGSASSGPATREYPEFPREEPGQRLRFVAHVLGWAIHCAWISFNKLPKWVRVLIYLWLIVILISRGCSSSHPRVEKISSGDAEKIKQIAQSFQGSSNKGNLEKLGSQIAHAISKDAADKPSVGSPLLAIPFSAHSGDAAEQKFADSTFALVYGRIAVSRHGHVGLADEPLASLDPALAVERARANDSNYVLYGGIDTREPAHKLIVKIASVEDSSVLWSGSYPVTGAQSDQIAAEVDSKVPNLED